MAWFRAAAVVALAMLAVAGGVAQEPPVAEGPVDDVEPIGRAYHVDELTRAAIMRYPGIKANEADIAAAQARLDEARLSPYFQWEGSARFFVAPGATGTPIFSPDPQIPFGNRWGPGGEVAIQAGIPIYTFGKIRGGKNAARAGIKSAEHERDKTLNRVVFDVRRAYYGVQLSLDLQTMVSEAKDKLRKTVDKLRARLDADDPRAKQSDYFRLAAALSEVESRESEALRLEASARQALEIDRKSVV